MKKVINGEKSAFNTPTFAQKRERTLDMLIKDLYSEYMNEGKGVSIIYNFLPQYLKIKNS